MSAHSKAPWTIAADEDGPYAGSIEILDDAGFVIADVIACESADETLANARIVASGPELLAMVKRYLDILPNKALPDADARELVARVEGRVP